MDPELARSLLQIVLGMGPTSAEEAQNWFWALATSLKRDGGPAKTRAAISTIRGMEGKLQYLRSQYGIAVPYGRSNFIYRDTDGRFAVLDAKGFEMADLIDAAPGIAEFVGGTAAAIPAAVVGGGVGGGAGAIAGAAVGAGMGATAGRELYERIGREALDVQDARSPGRQLRDAAVTAGVNAISQVAGDVALGPALRKVLPSARPRPAPDAGATLRAAEQVGVPVTPGQLAGRGRQLASEKAFARTGAGSALLDDVGRAQEEAMEAAAERIGARVGAAAPSPRYATGSRISDLVREMSEDIGPRQRALSEALEEQVGRETPIPLRNVARLRMELLAEMNRAPEVGAEHYGEALAWTNRLLRDAGDSGTLPFDVVRKTRTTVGRAFNAPDLSGYRPGQGALERVYAAISDDLGVAIKEIGPTAEEALKLHDEFVRFARSSGGRELNLAALQRIVQSDVPGHVYNRVMSEAGGDARQILAIRNSLRTFDRGESWDYVAGEIWRSLGERTSDGAWDPRTFLRNWTRMSQAAKEAIFNGTELVDSLTEMDALAKVSQAVVRGGGFPRGSYSPLNLLEAFRPTKMALGLSGLNRVKAKVYTNPLFLRWAAITIDGARRSPRLLPSMLTRLTAITARETDPEARAYLEELEEQMRRAASVFTIK